jgi:hypothetical protein
MTHAAENQSPLPRELGDGLVLRRSTAADAAALGDFNARIHSDEGFDKPDERLDAWTRDLLERPHPTFGVGDYTIVEDTHTGKIVSSLNLISQTWSYGGIPFGVGRPELVGTLPEYRNRGLVRAQFDEVHRWSAERGELLQAITGIPYYYRLFGYEMTVTLGGGRSGFASQVPELPDGRAEDFTIRPASEADLPFIAALYGQGCQRYPLACLWTPELWAYELNGKSEKNVNRYELHLIETAAGERAGFLAVPWFTWGDLLAVKRYELAPGFSWAQVTPAVIRFLRAAYETHPWGLTGERKPFGAFNLGLGEDHPAYHVLPDHLPRKRPPYAWYIRVADLPTFIRRVTPALEQRLANSGSAGYSGELHLTFYRDGLCLLFERGRLAAVKAWKPEPQGHSGEAAFPDHTFLQLLLGYRSLAELKYAFADCWTSSDATHALLEALFPRQPSDIFPVA